jgi:signal peptidase I
MAIDLLIQFLAVAITVTLFEVGGLEVSILSPALLALSWRIAVMVDAGFQARRGRLLSPRRSKRLVFYALFVLFYISLTFVDAAVLRASYVQAFRIPSASMVPTLLPGDSFIVDKHVYARREPQAGDVVVLRHPEIAEALLVRRIIARPGERVDYQGGHIRVNGRALPGSETRYGTPPTEVGAGHHFMLGDNIDRARDSGIWGSIPRNAILGRVMFIYSSVDPRSGHARKERKGRPVK